MRMDERLRISSGRNERRRAQGAGYPINESFGYSVHPIAKRAERMWMVDQASFYFGNAPADQVRGSGWFIGQFVPPELGLRRQTDVEVKWGLHPDGEKRSRTWANRNGTTISVLIRCTCR